MSDVDSKIKRSLAKISQAQKDLGAALDALKTTDYMQKLGDFAAKLIKVRTRLGDGVAQAGDHKNPLLPLSPNYVDERKALQSGANSALESQAGSEAKYQKKYDRAKYKSNLANIGGLSATTSPTKSNLTRTGQLLDSMSAKGATKTTVRVGPDGTRDDGKSNADIGEYVSKKRPFNNLSEIESGRVKDKIRLDAKAAIRKALNNK